jgi:hypothetical protein
MRVVTGFFKRLGHVILATLRVIDIVACLVWLSPLYLLTLADRPTGRQLISGYVGKAANHGHPWAKRMAKYIDWMACKLGDGPQHCHRAYLFYKPIDLYD